MPGKDIFGTSGGVQSFFGNCLSGLRYLPRDKVSPLSLPFLTSLIHEVMADSTSGCRGKALEVCYLSMTEVVLLLLMGDSLTSGTEGT